MKTNPQYQCLPNSRMQHRQVISTHQQRLRMQRILNTHMASRHQPNRRTNRHLATRPQNSHITHHLSSRQQHKRPRKTSRPQRNQSRILQRTQTRRTLLSRRRTNRRQHIIMNNLHRQHSIIHHKPAPRINTISRNRVRHQAAIINHHTRTFRNANRNTLLHLQRQISTTRHPMSSNRHTNSLTMLKLLQSQKGRRKRNIPSNSSLIPSHSHTIIRPLSSTNRLQHRTITRRQTMSLLTVNPTPNIRTQPLLSNRIKQPKTVRSRHTRQHQMNTHMPMTSTHTMTRTPRIPLLLTRHSPRNLRILSRMPDTRMQNSI